MTSRELLIIVGCVAVAWIGVAAYILSLPHTAGVN